VTHRETPGRGLSMLQGGLYQSRSTYRRVLVGSRAITMPHHLTTVPLARLGTEEVGGGLFLAVCPSSALGFL